MKTLFRLLATAVLLGLASCAFAQGILLPQDTPRAPFPRPLPGVHPLRVKTLRIDVQVRGQVATTRVSQVFTNDLNFQVDGVYFYPMPEDAAFADFATWEGEKKLRGEVLDKDEARNRYLAIVRKCWDPGLLEYAGANLFQARIFPVPPHGDKRIEFSYSQMLKADHGMVSYLYALHTGTKANPQPIGSLAVALDLRSEMDLKTIYSPTQNIDVHRDGNRHATLSYEAENVLPDRNFQIFYSLSNAEFGLNLITFRESGDDGYFMVLLSPKIEQSSAGVTPKDILFVLDTSGSMQESGKLEKALAALKFGVRSLNSGDRFNIITFSTETRRFRDALVTASGDVKGAAVQFIDRQAAAGGTNIHDALKEALGSFQSGVRPHYLVFLTDGLPTVGETDPAKILRDLSGWNGLKTRIFTFGVGYDVNTFLLDQVASRNYGASDYITPEEDLEVKLSNFFARVASPLMAGMELDWGGLHASDIHPRQLPDLFRGSQVTVMGRYTGSGTFPITLRGVTQGQSKALRYEGNTFTASTNSTADFLPRLWAMRKVGYLLEQIRMSGENPELKGEIVRLAKKYGFVTPYTSYLAADEKDIFTRNAPPRAMPLQMSVGASAAAPVAREAVRASKTLSAMKSADVSFSPADSRIRQIGAKTFKLEGDLWTDTAYVQGSGIAVDLKFGSEALLRLLQTEPEAASYAALGKTVIFVYKGRVYRIIP